MVGCQQQARRWYDDFQILVFSSIPEASLEEMKGFTKTVLEANMQVEYYVISTGCRKTRL